ncbi:hypothetical protein Dthio_PD3716 [Desulfonatronospira thiodismutans ASO3-1]|uniref:Uncharacterized protein n=1 Tax=Desulfonatronospira thiodismutans ASO3-1 TaxID=555779 RepID=D6SK53_9BACT|nr:hypothetical protein Dthio_PD3716 [Desulfonatronospira thiodismutans ASO3-1]
MLIHYCNKINQQAQARFFIGLEHAKTARFYHGDKVFMREEFFLTPCSS